MFASPLAKPKSKRGATEARTGAARLGRILPERSDAERGDSERGEAEPGIARIATGIAWDLSSISIFPAGAGEAFPMQAKLKAGALDDPLEREADRVAGEVMRTSEVEGADGAGRDRTCRVEAKLRAAVAGARTLPEGMARFPESMRGRGEPLAAPARKFFERRFDADFGGVRVHHGMEAGESARLLGARAYTVGRDIVFGAGEYSPGSKRTRKLLAHELTHVVQQGAGSSQVQRSPLSDSVKGAWASEPKIEALLARLSQADVQAAQNDGDVDAELANILAARPDDLWVAQHIRKGQLGQTTGQFGPKVAGKPVARPIEAYFFRGATDRRALVIAGVHGTERQGMEVARNLIHDLQAQTQPPGFTTVIVPSLFPDNAAGGMGRRESGDTPTNRNFPPPGEDLAAATQAGGGTAVDASTTRGARTRPILPENQMLLQLIERFHPERILSIHGTWGPGSAGVFFDRRSPSAAEAQQASQLAQGQEGGQELPPAVQERLRTARLAAISASAERTDRDLSLKAAQQIDAATAAIPGRGGRGMGRENESPAITAANLAARRAHPSIAGNVGPTGAIDNASWTGGVPGGVSLGGYAPPRGISVFTIEPPVNANSADYPTAADKVSQANRKIELQSYTDAVRTVLLGV